MTSVLCFDVEATSLLGDPFAIGGCVLSQNGQLLEQFGVQCPLGSLSTKPTDWVLNNVIGPCSSLPMVKGPTELLKAFWDWLESFSPEDVQVWVDWGYPVEFKTLLAAQHMFGVEPLSFFAPIHEVATLLILEPDLDRLEFAHEAFPWLVRHNPIHDALASAYTVVRRANCEQPKQLPS